MQPFEWHLPTLERVKNQALNQSLLISAEPGQGAARFAQAFTQQYFCPDRCGQCLSCQRLEKSEHPDVQDVVPEGKSHSHKIEAIRSLIVQAQTSTLSGKPRLLRVFEADRMNRASANGLLKFLEEPPPSTRFLLISEMPGNLPATIRSRCQQVRLPSLSDPAQWASKQEDPVLAGEAIRLTRAPETALALMSDPEALKQRSALHAALKSLSQPKQVGEVVQLASKVALQDVLDDWYALCVESMRAAPGNQKLVKFFDLLEKDRRRVLAQVALDASLTVSHLADLWIRTGRVT